GPGWQRVALPHDAPALAAPDGVDQFRGGEPALLFTADAPPPAPVEPRFGLTIYRFPSSDPDARALEIEFAAPLYRSRVDAAGEFDGAGTLPLISERRVAGANLRVDWSRPGLRAVVVTLHQHLRPTPLVRAFRLGAPRAFASYERGFLFFRAREKS